MSFRNDVNALRALAVALVILFHYKVPGFQAGFIGVDIFFVISGYLMTKLIWTGLDNGSFSYSNFIVARVARIWPALIFLMLALFVAMFYLLPPVDYLEYAKQARAAALFVSNHYFARDAGYFATQVDERWLLHTWSLSAEWQFYLLYPVYLSIVYLAGKRLGLIDRVGNLNLLSFALLVLIGASLTLSIYFTPLKPTSAFYKLPFRAWEMASGGLLLAMAPALKRFVQGHRNRLYLLALLLLAASLSAGAYGHWEEAWPGALALWPVLASLIFLAAHADASLPEPSWLKLAPIQAIGLWSYSIYLWHWPLLIGLNFLEVPEAHRPLFDAGAIGFSVMLGWASFRYVEKRFKIQSEGSRSMLSPPFVTAAFGFALVLGVSTAAISASGWRQRIAADRDFFEVHEDTLKADYFPVECRNFKASRATFKTCSLNPDAPGPRTLVYGDSHAQHLYPWFKTHAKSRVDFFTVSGCQMFQGYNMREFGYHCDDAAAVAAEKAMEPEYATIIVAGNYGYNLGRLAHFFCEAKNGSCEENHSVAPDDLIDANVRAYQRILDSGKTLLLLNQIPASFQSLPKRAMRYRFIGAKEPVTFEQARYPGVGSLSYMEQVYERIIKRETLVKVDFRQKLCKGVECSVYSAGVAGPILIDTSHFNPKWIVQNGSAFRPFVP